MKPRGRLLLAFAVAVAACLAQDRGDAVVSGIVRGAGGAPVAAATVELKNGGRTLSATTDAKGAYSFRALQTGTFTLHAAKAAVGEGDAGPFAIHPGENRKLDLTIEPAAKAEFFDEPTFIVAGVTDPALRGAHGSDPVFRSAEKLTKETVSLRSNSPAARVSEQALREAIGREPNRAELHHALADEEESRGNALDAAREYQRAAELEQSEPNLFDWGVELLRHHAAEQADAVFTRGVGLYPRSTRMLLGLAVALYSRGFYEKAAEGFFEAADLNAADPVPYLFLGRLSAGAITDSAGYAERLKRFASLQPENAWANYYYAACLWRHRGNSEEGAATAAVQGLLEKAVRLDPHLGAGFLLLGVVLADEGRLTPAIHAYEQAIAADPGVAEAHYRLAQALEKSGEGGRARAELVRYRELSKQAATESERERAGIQDFVFALRER